jgi:hypothetical protein
MGHDIEPDDLSAVMEGAEITSREEALGFRKREVLRSQTFARIALIWRTVQLTLHHLGE